MNTPGVRLGLLAVACVAALAIWADTGLEVAPRAASAGATHTAEPAPAPTGSVPNAEHAANGARTPACVPAASTITVVDVDTRQPLRDATVAWRTMDGSASGRSLSDDEGRAPMARAPLCACELTIVCHGHAPLRGILPASATDPVVGLAGAGELQVAARDAAGRPMPGVSIVLLPPSRLGGGFCGDVVRFATAPTPERDAQRALPELVLVDGVYRLPAEPAATDLEWQIGALWHEVVRQQRTDENGIATWPALPAATDYRFALLPPRQGELDPPHERRRLTPGPDGVLVGRAPPPNVSGVFAIGRGETTTVGVRMLQNGTIRGRVAAPPGARCQANLFSVTQAGGSDDENVTALDVAGVRPVGDRGDFVFEGVRPGDYALRSCWLEAGCAVHFVSATLRVPPGADVDLGTLAPTAGNSVVIDVGLWTSYGRPSTVDAVFAEPAGALAALSVGVAPASRTLADTLHEVVVVPLATPITFHGLPPGRLHVTARPTDAPCGLVAGTRLRAGETLEAMLPLAETVRPRLLVETSHRVAIECRGADGTPRTPMCVSTRRRADGRVETRSVEADGAFACADVGDYEVFVSLSSGAVAECATAALTIAQPAAAPQTLCLDLQLAATVSGRLVGPEGRPVAGRLLRWTLPRWAGREGTWLFTATTDSEGAFSLSGIPPGVELHASPDTPPLPIVAPGANPLVLVSR